MAQTPLYVNIGTFPNDGTGTPIRSAFNDTNLNFANVFAAGPVGSNIAIQNNSILSTNTNGNIYLVANGIGRIVPQSSIVPDINNIRDLGAPNRRFRNLFAQNLDTLATTIHGNMTVSGNLIVLGNTVTTNIANLNVANSVITLSSGATTPGMADGSGIHVAGAEANIYYSAATDTWDFNKGLGVAGFVQARGFIGDGGWLSNIQVTVTASSLAGNTLNPNIINSSLTSVGTLTDLTVSDTVTAGYLVGDGSQITNIRASTVTGNVAQAQWSTYANVALAANVAQQAIFSTNSEYAVTAGYAARTATANTAITAQTALYADVACTATTANVAVIATSSQTSGTAVTVTGNAQPFITSVGVLNNLTVNGNIYGNALFSDGYYYANGVPVFSATSVGLFDNQTIICDGSNAIFGLDNQTVTGNILVSINGVMQVPNIDFKVTPAGNAIRFMAVPIVSDIAEVYFFGQTTCGGGTAPTGQQVIVPDGVNNSYALNRPAQTSNVIVSINGITQLPGDDYAIAGGNIIFASTPALYDTTSVWFFNGPNGTDGIIGAQAIVPDGINYSYKLAESASNTSVMVTINGVLQTPNDDFNITGNIITFANSILVTDIVYVFFFNGLGTSLISSCNSYGNANVNALLSQYTGNLGAIAPTSIATNDYLWGNGQPLISNLYGNANVAAYLPTYTGSLQAGSANITGNLTVSGSGGISVPNLPAFRVYGSSSGNIVAGTTISGAQGAAVDYNQGSSYNSGTGIFTAPRAGIYRCFATLRVGNTAGMSQASIQKNSNATGANVVAFWEVQNNTSVTHMSMTGDVKLATGDTVRLQVLTGTVRFDSNDSWGVTCVG